MEAQEVVHEETGGRRLRELGQPADLDAGELAAAQSQDPEDARRPWMPSWERFGLEERCSRPAVPEALNGPATSGPSRPRSPTRRRPRRRVGGARQCALPVRLDSTGVSLALRWAFMRGWFLDRRCFHNPIVPAPPRMNNLLQPSHLVPPQPYARDRDRTQPTFFARSHSDPTAPVRFGTTLPTRL